MTMYMQIPLLSPCVPVLERITHPFVYSIVFPAIWRANCHDIAVCHKHSCLIWGERMPYTISFLHFPLDCFLAFKGEGGVVCSHIHRTQIQIIRFGDVSVTPISESFSNQIKSTNAMQ